MSDIIIVLGNYLVDDGSLSLINRERCFHAYGLYKSSKNCVLLLSGGVVNEKAPCSEAEAMKRYFLALGVAENAIITETKSRNTFENTKFCGEILASMEYNKLILVSSSYHVNRGYFNPVKFFARYTHLSVMPFPCFDSGIKLIKFSEEIKDTELIVYKNKKHMLAYTDASNKNCFAIRLKGKQQINKEKIQFFDNTANINELTKIIKNIYGVSSIAVVRI